jgi:hypothetical protein
MRRPVVLLIAALSALICVAPAAAATFTVTTTTDTATATCVNLSCTSIRVALVAAASNGVATPDTIVVPAGTTTLTQAAGGQLDIQSDVTLVGASAATTTIQGDGTNFRVVNVGNSRTVSLTHLTIKSGAATSATSAEGGGVRVSAGATATLNHVRITQSKAWRGGGLAILNGTVTMTASLVDNNSAVSGSGGPTGDGGGILVLGNPNPSTLTLMDSTVALNNAIIGGGIMARDGASNFTDILRSTVAYNDTGASLGGGLLIADVESFLVSASLIAGNTGNDPALGGSGLATTNCGTFKPFDGGGDVDSGTDCNFTLGSDRHGADPHVSPQLTTANTGGETPVLPIPRTSNAVDLDSCFGTLTDQRDLARPQGANCDAGAYEFDQTPPVSTITSGPSGPTNIKAPTFAFTTGEPDSTFECKLTGPGTSLDAACTSPKSYSNLADGTYFFALRATDSSGNVETNPPVVSFTVDTVAPTATITAHPPALTNGTSWPFSFTSSESGSTFKCELDAPGTSSSTNCASGDTFNRLGIDGSYTFRVHAIDAAGNPGPEATFAFTVDTVGPAASLTGKPGLQSNDNSPTFSFTSEAGATFECSFGPGSTPSNTYTSCTSPKTYTGLADGFWTFRVRAIDAAGNVGSTGGLDTFELDATPPETSITGGPSGPTNVSAPSFTFSATEPSTFQCKLDGPGTATGTYASCSTPRSLGTLADGTYTFTVQATDQLGNPDPTPATRTFTVDTVAPDTTVGAGPSGTVNVATQQFAFSSSEANSTFECKLEGPAADGLFAPCLSPANYSLADGDYTFSVRATDAAGNVDQTPATRSFTVDTTPPAAPTIDGGPAGATTDTSPVFAFSDSEAGVTFQCRLDGPAGEGGFHACTSPQGFFDLPLGDYTLLVQATDPAGNVSTTHATRGFSVTSVQQATPTPTPTPAATPAPTPAPTPAATPAPTPIFHQSVVLAPAGGTTLVETPGAKTFAPVTVKQVVPLGSIVDTRKSSVALTSLAAAGGTPTTAKLSGGLFKVTQSGAITKVQLVEKLAPCKSARKPKGRKLSGDGAGSFQIRGLDSTTTIRGSAVWLVQDSCAGTQTRVTRGLASVNDLRKHKTVLLKSGKAYLARPKR